MRIAYCTNVRLPSERAHGHQIAQVCDALDMLGHTVTVYAPYRRNPVTQEYHAYYGARPGVTLRHLGSFDSINRAWLPGVLGLWVLNALLRLNYRRALRKGDTDLLYTRAPALLPALLGTGIPVVLELHQLPRLHRARFVQQAGRCRLVACLTRAMRDELVSWGVPAGKVIAEGDAVELRRFASFPSIEAAQQEVGISTDRLVVGYVGRLKTLGMEKGVKHLLEALKELQDQKRFYGLIVGGPVEDIHEYKRLARTLGLTGNDIRFIGEVPASRVPLMLAACDVLAMPFPDLPHYRMHMSPLKMFEYMAAGRTILTSDLPTVRDVLSEKTAYFCKPGDSTDLAYVLREIDADHDDATARASAARKLVEHHTWEQRMRRILDAATLSS